MSTSTSNCEPISGVRNETPSVAIAAGQHTSAATVPEGQAIATSECTPSVELEAQARESDSESSRAESSSSSDSDDSDTDNLSDHTTCYKRMPRQEVRYSPPPTGGEATRMRRERQLTKQSGGASKGDGMLKDAIQWLTQELNALRQDFKTVAETQQTVIQELRETNKQLQESNEYYQFLLEIENRKHQASAVLVEQCQAANQR